MKRNKDVIASPGSINGVTPVVHRDRCAARKSFGFLGDDVVVAFIGRVTRDKGIHELASCWERLASSNSTAHLLIAGSTGDEPGDAGAVGRLARLPRTHVLGYQSNIAAIFGGADILVLPSHREGVPGVVLQAAAYAVPSIVTDATGVSEAVLPDVTGVVVPAGDISALTSALEAMIEEQELRERMGIAAERHVMEHYDQDQIHSRWQRLITELASR